LDPAGHRADPATLTARNCLFLLPRSSELCQNCFHAILRQYTRRFWVQVEGQAKTVVTMVGGQAPAAEAAGAAALATSVTRRALPLKLLKIQESFRENLSKEAWSTISTAT